LPETYSWATIDITQALRGDSNAGLISPYCKIVTPFQTSFRGLVTYVVPKVDLQVAATWRSDPGPALAANYVVTNAIANSGPQPLGRDLSVAKILHYRRTRMQIGVDLYNVMNTDVVTSYNPTFVPNGSWLIPATVNPTRYAKINLQIDF
jgi:hypothetical protein